MSLLQRLKSWLNPVDGTVGAPSGGPHPLPRDEPGDWPGARSAGAPDPDDDSRGEHRA